MMRYLLSLLVCVAALGQDWTWEDQAAVQAFNLTSTESSTLVSGLQEFYAFDETTTNNGSAANYGSGTFYVFGPATIVGTATGKFGNAWTNSGSGTAGIITNTVSALQVATNADLTVSYWRYRTEAGTEVLGEYDVTGSGGWCLREDGAIKVNYMTNGVTPTIQTFTGTIDYNNSAWELYIVTIANSDNTVSVSYNGSAFESYDISPYQVSPTTEPFSLFGVHNGTTGYASRKTIDEVCAWNRKLTDAEAAELYNSGNGLNMKTVLGL